MVKEPQYAMLQDDYAKYISRQLGKAGKTHQHKVLDEFLEVFDKIMAFQQSSRFTNVLPSDIRKLYAALMTDDAYLMQLSLS